MSLRPLPRPAPPPPPLFFRGGCPSTGGPAVCVSPAWRSVVKTHLRSFQSQPWIPNPAVGGAWHQCVLRAPPATLR